MIELALRTACSQGQQSCDNGVVYAILARLYAARGFVYAARYLVAMAFSYLDDPLLREDAYRIVEELEALLNRLNASIASLVRR